MNHATDCGHGDQTAETVIRIEPETTTSTENESSSSSSRMLHENRPHIHNAPAPNGVRSWRMNLNDVLSFSTAPIRTEALRSLISHSNSFRYTPLNSTDSTANATANVNNNDNVHILVQEPRDAGSSTTPTVWRMNSRSNSMLEENSNSALSSSSNAARINVLFDAPESDERSEPTDPLTARLPPGDTSNRNNTHNDLDEENNVISNGLVQLLSILLRYLPFIGIVFAKFLYDHLWGILDLLLLHAIMYQLNKSLREQISKFSQKSYTVLMRDFSLVICTVSYRMLLSSTSPDPFGLLIPPPNEIISFELPSNAKVNVNVETVTGVPGDKSASLIAHVQQTSASSNPLDVVALTKAVSLGVLLYYVAVNDLVLKLLTILLKITITMLPTKIIRHKSRARMFVLVEYFSQFYRAVAPVRQWLMFLLESYSGIEVIIGVLFSSFYMGAKGFEFVERGKSLRKAAINFLRNMDYERKPTKEELDTAGPLCPICHDAYTTPIVLECGHIFCDDCVSTWFKREQTCPMCRAKVSEDPTWQDGSTSFFYELC